MCSLEKPSGVLAGKAEAAKMPLVVILGPTAVGKTEIAIQLAERLEGEIVSADSRLFYRGMDIGTAKPTEDERRRVTHHLIDVARPDETWSLAMYLPEAHKAIAGIQSRHHLPFLVGGTGQFVRSIIEGWSIPAAQPDPRLRSVLTEWAEEVGAAGLHARLSTLDPEAAKAIDPSNVRRVIRALEVIIATGRRFSEQKLKGYRLYQTLTLGLTMPRSELYQRIDARIANMFECGLIEEVKHLLDAGYPLELPTMSAIGYAEVGSYLQGKLTKEEAIMLMKRRTREFVRRQVNWFKENDPNIVWFQVNEQTRVEMEKVIRRWLSSRKSESAPESGGE